MGGVWALLSAADTALLATVLDAATDGMKRDEPADGRTHAQRRADALTQMVHTAWQAGHLGGVDWGQRLATRHGRRPEIGVLVPITTLLGVDDQPGQLPGYGPLPASVARRIAAGGVWRRILTDPVTGRGPRLRHHPLHPAPGAGRLPGRPRPHLPRPGLRPARARLRHRPHPGGGATL
jgi:hypothetical protein